MMIHLSSSRKFVADIMFLCFPLYIFCSLLIPCLALVVNKVLTEVSIFLTQFTVQIVV